MSFRSEDPFLIGEEEDFVDTEGLRDADGGPVGVDVVRLAVLADADRGDHRDRADAFVLGLQDRFDRGRTDGGDFADEAEFFPHRFAEERAGVRTGEPDRADRRLVQGADDPAVHFPTEDHLDDFHHLRRRDPEAVDEVPGDPAAFELAVDRRSAAVDEDDVHARAADERKVLAQRRDEALVLERGSAELDQHARAREFLHVAERAFYGLQDIRIAHSEFNLRA